MTPSESSTLSSAATLEALQQSEARLKLATEAGGVGLWDWDLRANTVYFSPEYKRQLGYADDELPNRFEEWERRLHPDDRSRTLTTVERYIAEPWPDFESEFRLRHRDGSYRWIMARAMLQYDAAGKAVRMLGSHIDITARKQAEEALRDSEERFRATFEQAAVGIAQVAPDGRWLQVNRKLCDIVGYSQEELSQRSFQDITYPEDLDADLAFVRRMLAGEIQTYGMEKRYVRKDRSLVWIYLTVGLVRQPTSEPKYFIAVVEDISERKRAEAALQESQRALATLIRNFPGMIYRCRNDKDWTTDFVSDGVFALTGYSPSDLRTGEVHFGQIIHPDDRELVWNTIQTALREKRPYTLTYRIHTASGPEKWVWEQGQGTYSPSGELVYLEGFVADITDRKRAEMALQQSEQRLRDLIDGLGPNMFVGLTTPDGILLEANRPALAAAGLKLEDVLGNPVEETYWVSYSEESKRRMRAAIERAARGEPSRYDVAIRVGESQFTDIDFSIHPLRDREGKVAFLVPSAVVITERKRAEAEKLRLEHLLMQSQKMEAIGQLTAGIAHDFNNILASVLGYSSLALEQYVPDTSSKLGEYLREVQTAGNRARELVASLLAFSRTGSANRRRVLVGPLVKEVMKTLAAAIRSSIELTTNIEASDAHVVADPVQLYQVIMNLVINARDALGEHGRIAVGVRRSHLAGGHCAGCHADLGGDFVELTVSDTGRGIPADVLPHIFEPFFTTNATGKGSGVGLSVVHGVVHDCGGHVLVESTPGQGTIMRIVLPEAVAAEATAATPLAGPAPVQPVDGRHILVVDDDAALGQLIGETLQARGYLVTIYTDSRAALDRFAAAPAQFDALISDQTMPGLTGVELAKAVRALQPELPIILCTGYSATLDPELATQLGVRLFYKPAPFEGLIPILAELFAAHPGAGKPARILLVDDDASVLILMTRILERLNYKISGVSDAETALATLTANPREYDVLVTDIGLPGRSGLELARAARHVRPDLPVILTTGALRPGEVETARGLGIQDIVLKPNTVRELGTTLDRLVRKARRARD